MKIVLRIDEMDVAADIVSTDWQIASDKEFTNIVVEDIGDSVNKTYKVFDTNLLRYGSRYYSRCRLLLNNAGYTEWSNVFSFIAKDNTLALLDMSTPMLVPIPTVISPYELSDHPVNHFRVALENSKLLSDTKHIATTWIIEDIYGKTIYLDKSAYNLKELTLPYNFKLQYNSVYIISAIIHTDSGDSSGKGSLTIKTIK